MIGFKLPHGIKDPSGRKDSEATKGLVYHQAVGGDPYTRAEATGNANTRGTDQKPNGPARSTVKKAGKSFQFC